jgi:hypothetical protein
MSLRTCYNVNDPRSYKTICPKCNSVRSLSIPISCCMQKTYCCYFHMLFVISWLLYLLICNISFNVSFTGP